MKRIIYLLLFFTTYSAAQNVILNEIMFYPASGNNEFIELYNASVTESIDLNGFKIKYYSSSADVIAEAGEGTILPPQSYAVILEGDYDFLSGIYNNLIPDESLILKISDNYFGSTGMANTSDRPIWLLSASNDTLDVYTYSADNLQTHSDEKITIESDSSQINWSNSIPSNGTPGFRNSVAPVNFDLSVGAISVLPLIPVHGNNISINAVIKNSGENNADSYQVRIFNDLNLDSIPQSAEQIYLQNYYNLNPDDSVIATTEILSIPAGFYNIIVKAIFSPDEDTLNNTAYKNFTVYPAGNLFNDIVINEIMYAPSSDEPEWIEIYNKTPSAININKWKFSDDSHTTVITNRDMEIPGESFIVLTKDSLILTYYSVPSEIIEFNMPALNNTGDAVVIKDSLGIIIDSLVYSPDWGGNDGKSLERISVDESGNEQDNWHTSESIFKATPGKINSVTPKDNDLKISSFKSTRSYGIAGEPVEFEVQINNAGINISPGFSIYLYDDLNQDSIPQVSELISQLSSSSLSPGDSIILSIISESCSEGNNYFIAGLNAFPDDDTTNNIAYSVVVGIQIYEQRNDLVINEFMYDPDSPQPEWIEIFNRSKKIIDLKNYHLADAADTVIIIRTSLLINPDEYVVISSDSTILNYFYIPSYLIIKSLPTLNNSGDKIILLDSLEIVIDSLQYSDVWGGEDGKSLERINTENPSADDNWAPSKSRHNGTPGYLNSVTKKAFDISVNDIISSPLYPSYGDSPFLKIKVSNYGMNPANFSLRLFEDTSLDSLPDVLLQTISNLNLQPGDSSVIESGYTIYNLQSSKYFYAEVIFESDMDTSNNYLIKNISPGYPPSTILINEIMYSPSGGEPEWVEIFNTSDDSISLLNWSVSDVVTTPSSAVLKTGAVIPSDNYIVLAKDSSIFNYHRCIPSEIIIINLPVLNNDADGFLLKDSRGQTMDSVFFRRDWGGINGYSLERISIEAGSNVQSNWGSSEDIEFSTPGRINSITPKTNDIVITKISSEPEFPIEGDNVFISAMIKNKGSQAATGIKAEFLYDSDSDKVIDKVLSSKFGIDLNSEDSINIVSAESIQNLFSGILTAVKVYFPADEDSLNNYGERFIQYGSANRDLVINEIMYDPPNGEPEWIELLNISSDSINLNNWSVSDLLTTPSRNFITDKEFYIQPDNFVVIAMDTSFYSFHPDIKNVFITNFGTLGNSDDGVVVYDFRDAVIDSVHYESEWGGKNGYSLERIAGSLPSDEKNNWASCLSPDKSTPGLKNSILDIPSASDNSVVINEIMFDPGIDNCEFIEFYNRSIDSINIGGWRIEDEKGNSCKLSDSTFMIKSGDYFLLSADTIILEKYSLQNYANISFKSSANLGLSNEGELILLKDVRNTVIDSVVYSSKWSNKNINVTKNKSLERINPGLNANYPDNWSTCVNTIGATPGKQNSIYANNKDLSSNISVSPNPFSPDNDGFEDFSIINYSLTHPTSQIRIKIFDNRGRLVRTLANNQASSSHGSIIFDGLGDDGLPLRIGIYIILLEATNENSGSAEILKTIVVIARKL